MLLLLLFQVSELYVKVLGPESCDCQNSKDIMLKFSSHVVKYSQVTRKV